MKIIVKEYSVVTFTARELAVGSVYTWGARRYHYLRTEDGAVCLDDGVHVPDDYLSDSHFRNAVIVAGEVTLTLEH